MSIKLPTSGVAPGVASAASFTTAGTLLTIPAGAKPWAKFVCRHTGSSGTWYGCYEGRTPTTSSYDFVLDPGEPHERDNPPLGAIKILASSAGVGSLSYAADWSV